MPKAAFNHALVIKMRNFNYDDLRRITVYRHILRIGKRFIFYGCSLCSTPSVPEGTNNDRLLISNNDPGVIVTEYFRCTESSNTLTPSEQPVVRYVTRSI